MSNDRRWFSEALPWMQIGARWRTYVWIDKKLPNQDHDLIAEACPSGPCKIQVPDVVTYQSRTMIDRSEQSTRSS